MFVEMMTKHC